MKELLKWVSAVLLLLTAPVWFLPVLLAIPVTFIVIGIKNTLDDFFD